MAKVENHGENRPYDYAKDIHEVPNNQDQKQIKLFWLTQEDHNLRAFHKADFSELPRPRDQKGNSLKIHILE